MGIVLGAWNCGGGLTMLIALRYLPGVVVFPVSSALGLVLTACVALLVWRERISGWAAAGIGLAVASATLMNL